MILFVHNNPILLLLLLSEDYPENNETNCCTKKIRFIYIYIYMIVSTFFIYYINEKIKN